mgnify:FL=1
MAGPFKMKAGKEGPMKKNFGSPMKNDRMKLARMHYNTGGVRKGGDGGESYRKRFGKGTDAETAYNEIMANPKLKAAFDKAETSGE